MDIAFTHNSRLADREPAWPDVERTSLPRIAFARMGEADKKSSWGYPHHWIQNGREKNEDGIYTQGTMYLHRGGLQAAWNYAMGAGTGEKAERAVIAHLRKHFADLGIRKSELASLTPVPVDVEALDAALVAEGLLTAADLDEWSVVERVTRLLRRPPGVLP